MTADTAKLIEEAEKFLRDSDVRNRTVRTMGEYLVMRLADALEQSERDVASLQECLNRAGAP